MVRRSSRTRQQPSSAYDQELELLAQKKNKPSQDSDSEDSSVEKEVREAMQEEDDENELSDPEDEEEFSPVRKTKSPSPVKQNRARGNSQRAIQIKVGRANLKTRKGNAAGARSSKAIQSALSSLSKKLLDASETPETSLLAALLASAKPIPGIESSVPRTNNAIPHKSTVYTPQLIGIARHLIQEHEPNSMHTQLLNLLFRSVGGSIETNLKGGVDLEELDDDEWDTLVTEVVQVMQECEIALFTAAPQDKVGLREYRGIYKEFWYRLGVVVLSHTAGTSGNDEELDGASPQAQSFASNRFQVEMMRDLISRVTELVLVGQPDLRAGATMAVFELAKACMERTVELSSKCATAQRQYAASKGQSRKMQALQTSIDSWKRHQAELEALVEESVIQGVFIRRYRDSSAHIRCLSLETLSHLTLLRPDIYLKDKYLKYMGWMASDKDEIVRLAALNGLLLPLKRKMEKRPAGLALNLDSMQNVFTKFLPRIADCTEDSQSLAVQEIAMELIVKLMNEGFMDEWDDDAGWDQLNLKALDSSTTPSVRKNALYLILDQLDCFDDSADTRTAVSNMTLSERQQTVRIDGIARWAAHLLCNGPVSVDKIKIELTDFIVQSLRSMPEHKSLTTSWSAMLKAIRSDNTQHTTVEREELAKTRILLRMLSCAAELEVGSATTEKSSTKKAQDSSSIRSKEALSLAILKSLPNLIAAFKSDDLALRSLTKLPQYLIPEVFSLPARKNDFSNLTKSLCTLFQESTDEVVLQEVANVLAIFASGDHARVSEVKMRLGKVSKSLHDRLMNLFAASDPDSASRQSSASGKKHRASRNRSGRQSDLSTSHSITSELSRDSQEADTEHAICLCLARWRILLKAIPMPLLFSDTDNLGDDDAEGAVEGFFKTVAEGLGKRLMDRKPLVDEQDKKGSTGVIAPIWKTGCSFHGEVANAIDVGLDVLLCLLAWTRHETIQSDDGPDEIEADDEGNVSNLLVGRLRTSLVNLIGLAFEQYLEDFEGLVYSDEQEEFAARVQASAGRVASDLRTLFPKEWGTAKNSKLRALALKDDFQLIGGFVRYLQSRQDELTDPEKSTEEEITVVKELILPIARALTANWTYGNRKEAGIVLSHLTGSGKLTGQTVLSLARSMKKIQPVRFLEAQMAALRMVFQSWIDGEPEEPPEDGPTEDQLQEYEQAARDHQSMFVAAERLASRLSMSLGVGKLNDDRLSQALLNFLQEGIRFAFEGDAKGEDDLVLGSRLPFLMLLMKYSTWVKKNKSHLEVLKGVIFAKESALREHPEFDEVHEDDMRCILEFKASLGVASPKHLGAQSPQTDDEASIEHTSRSPVTTPMSSVASSARRRVPSTAGSKRSRLSVQSNLSPLPESPEDTVENVNESPSPQKRRRSSRYPRDDSPIEEEASESESE